MTRKIQLKPYKGHKGKTTQYSYRGVALTPIEQRLAFILNDIIDEIQAMKKFYSRSSHTS